MWVEFVVGFLPPQKPTFPNSTSTWNAWSPLNKFLESSLVLYGQTDKNIYIFFFYKMTLELPVGFIAQCSALTTVVRALHWYLRGYGFEFCSNLNLFSGIFFAAA